MMTSNHLSHFSDSSYQAVRLSSFVEYKNWRQKSNKPIPVFVEVDIGKQAILESESIIPVLSWQDLPSVNFAWTTTSYREVESRYAMYAQAAHRAGYEMVVLSMDEDGLLHQLLSPRFHLELSFKARLEIICNLVKAAQREIPQVAVALTVEELCPGGMDATDGIETAVALETLGISFILANAGTRDFPALKNRRPTKIKNEAESFPDNQEVHLASCLWLVDRLKIPIWAHSHLVADEKMIQAAQASKIAGIVYVVLR